MRPPATTSTVHTVFLRITSIILLSTAALKTISALGASPVLALRSPLFSFLDNRQLLVVTAALEVTVVAFLTATSDCPTKLAMVAWLSTVFVLYRIALVVTGHAEHTCPCLGTVTDWWPKGDKLLTRLSGACLIFMSTGSYGMLIPHLVRRRLTAQKNDL